MTVRELRVRLATPGCRTRVVVVVTTLTDAALYPNEDLADLYHQRWHAELDIRAIQQSLKLDHLRCLTPFLVEKAIWAHFLGDNRVRKVSAQAALTQGIHPRALSFTATTPAVAAAWSQATLAPTAAERVRQGQLLLPTLGTKPVGNRPDRSEPRAVKRRPKESDRLMKPRAEARAELPTGKGRGGSPQSPGRGTPRERRSMADRSPKAATPPGSGGVGGCAPSRFMTA